MAKSSSSRKTRNNRDSGKSKNKRDLQQQSSGAPSLSPNRRPRTKRVRIEVIAPNPKTDPIVVSFPGGVPAEKQSEEIRFQWKKSSETCKEHGRTVIGENATAVYRGSSDRKSYLDCQKDDQRITKLCVGVYDKSAGVIKLYQAAEEGTVFDLSQKVKSYKRGEAIEEDTYIKRITTTAMERRKMLFEDFGSQKKRRVLKSQEANVVTVDSVVGGGSNNVGWVADAVLKDSSESNKEAWKQAKQAMESEGLNDGDEQTPKQQGNRGPGIMTDKVEEAVESNRRKMLSPLGYNKSAAEADGVYSARTLAGDEVWGRISRVTDACWHKGVGEKNEIVTALMERGYWQDCVKDLLRAGDHVIAIDSPSAKDQIKCCILLNYYLNFLHSVMRRRGRLYGSSGAGGASGMMMAALGSNGSELSRTLRLPEEVTQRLVGLYMEEDSISANDGGGGGSQGRRSIYQLSKEMKVMCQWHILILFVLCHGKSMKVSNVQPILDALNSSMDSQTALQCYRSAGFTVGRHSGSGTSAGTGNTSVQLKIPLTFPSANPVGSSGGRR